MLESALCAPHPHCFVCSNNSAPCLHFHLFGASGVNRLCIQHLTARQLRQTQGYQGKLG